MQEQLTRELLNILEAVNIVSPTSFSFAGNVISVHGLVEQQRSGPEQTGLVAQLVPQLYHRCYCRKFDGAAIEGPPFPVADNDFVKQLADANASRDRLSRGWQVLRLLPTGHYAVEKNGCIRLTEARELISDDGSADALAEGALVSICWPGESTATQAGFYFAIGEAITDQQDETDLLKLYWNIRPDGAPALVRLLTQRFNRLQTPFRLKCLKSRAAYGRADAAVLYISRRFFRVATPLVTDVHCELEGYLEPHVPLFSKPMARGLGLAEEPANGESFGEQRCRILAEAIWSAFELELHGGFKRLEEVSRQFERYGLSLEHPYLNPGSVDEYAALGRLPN